MVQQQLQTQQQIPIPNVVDTAEMKKQQRIIRNRISAQLHRERKSAYMKDLETQVIEKDRIITDLRVQVDCLNNRIIELSNINLNLQKQLDKSQKYQNQIIDQPLPISDEIISSDEGMNKTNSVTSSPISSSDDYSSESSAGSPDIGIISDTDSPNINTQEDFFNFEPNLDENEYLFFNSDNLFSSPNNNNSSHSASSFNQYNSIIIGLLIFTIPLLLLTNGLPSVGFGITKNEIRMTTNINNNNNNRFLVESDHFPALPEAVDNIKLNPYVTNPPPDPALNSFNDHSSDMSKAISIYKHKPLNNDIFALKRWESNLHNTLKNNANDVSKQLFCKKDDMNSKNNHLRHGHNGRQQQQQTDLHNKFNSSYIMCPNAFGKMLLYDKTYINDGNDNNSVLNLTNTSNSTNGYLDNEKPFLLLLIPRNHIQLEGEYNESENDKVEWVEVACNVIRSRVVRNLGL